MAAAISCYVYLSAVPVLIISVAVWGYLLGSPHEAQNVVMGYLHNFAPSFAADQSNAINGLVADLVKFRGTATWVGMLGLLWAGTGLITALDKAVNHVFGIPGFRGMAKERLLAVALLPVLTFLFGLSVAGTSLVKAVERYGPGYEWMKPTQWPVFWVFDSYIIPLLITIAAFALLYKVLPRRRVPWKAAMIGAVAAGIIWEAIKQVFSYYVSLFPFYSRIYGSLGGIILWMFWVNWSCMVIVLGAEITMAVMKDNKSD